ncbi:MAG: hypothetical protein CL947_00665 [Epsilonproteobacteria bacterium]|nr:hypothetical protein [Campylobacterota bacterium]|tara:strand:+ start:383 stop:1102 length:720 start_codon:yes stop_codon:yes gene_type:complete
MCSELDKVSSKDSKRVFFHELGHHLPYATLAVACSLLLISLLFVFFQDTMLHGNAHMHSHGCGTNCCHGSGMDILFHTFHYIHIIFAVSGSMVMFYRYAQRLVLGIVIGTLSASFFCTLSDVLLPYLAGIMLGKAMDLHICFFTDFTSVVPFLIIGALNGLVMFYIKDFKTEANSLNLHFFHTFVSAVASIFYSIGHGFADYHSYLGIFFLLMLGAVVLPCTLADVVVPIIIARMVNKK